MLNKETKMKKEQGTCPVCNGTTRRPCPDNLREYGQKNGWYGYGDDDCVTCNNCGGQYQFGGKPTGKVNLREDGTPCRHEYEGKNLGRCYNGYTCKHCGDHYTIDSSD